MPIVKGKEINLISWSLDKSFQSKGKTQIGIQKYIQNHNEGFKESIEAVKEKLNYKTLMSIANELYDINGTTFDQIIEDAMNIETALGAIKHYYGLQKEQEELQIEQLAY